MTEDIIARIEFQNTVTGCRKKLDDVLDIYREVIGAFEKQDWEAKGPALALSNAEKAGTITKLERTRLSEDWQSAIQEAQGAKGIVADDFSVIQEKLERKLFNIPFDCALDAVSKLKFETGPSPKNKA